jgi:hypothetical protein
MASRGIYALILPLIDSLIARFNGVDSILSFWPSKIIISGYICNGDLKNLFCLKGEKNISDKLYVPPPSFWNQQIFNPILGCLPFLGL